MLSWLGLGPHTWLFHLAALAARAGIWTGAAAAQARLLGCDHVSKICATWSTLDAREGHEWHVPTGSTIKSWILGVPVEGAWAASR